ncbi:NADP-dependent oxidoreductase [Streptomyces sp. NBC_01264]|uniref:NADP-dependent oxidoreductase n=1 Tax=Streptomyces sp. NBC_01264 TaxID=2903804 RepID=UPI002251319F|nr:NADP-dependent oxidoreductase [Streptomyces sp. NBC_01264]MCX4780720.1 NADP-dependent oxidoreductase [Streptomyces sp. NBC_01264]
MQHTTSRRAVVRVPSGPRSIRTVTVPLPEPGPDQIRVEVAAAAVNPVDLGVAGGVFHRLGLVDQPQHTGLGWDFAGTVDAVGPGVELRVGTRVAGFLDGFDRDHGSHAEHLLVSAAKVAVVPDALDLVEAAVVPLNATAAAQLVDLLGEAPAGGRRLLVTGAAGAVGAYAAVLAQDRGWEVTGTARTADEPFVRGLGADFATGVGQGWDAVADAGALQEDALRAVRDGGRFVGVQPAPRLPEERGITVGVLFARPDGPLLARLLERAATGELPARVHAVVPLADAADAYEAMAKGGVRGRIVLVP